MISYINFFLWICFKYALFLGWFTVMGEPSQNSIYYLSLASLQNSHEYACNSTLTALIHKRYVICINISPSSHSSADQKIVRLLQVALAEQKQNCMSRLSPTRERLSNFKTKNNVRTFFFWSCTPTSRSKDIHTTLLDFIRFLFPHMAEFATYNLVWSHAILCNV